MSRRLTGRLERLEARQGVGADREEEFARDRALHQRIQECAREDPELYRRYQDSLDEHLFALERARVRSRTTGDDPEEDPEVLAATRAYEEIEARLLDENNDDEGRRH